jgi:hypothetical protein
LDVSALKEMRLDIAEGAGSARASEPLRGSRGAVTDNATARATIPSDPEGVARSLALPELKEIVLRICERGAYDPVEVENACVGLSLGHLMLAGPTRYRENTTGQRTSP